MILSISQLASFFQTKLNSYNSNYVFSVGYWGEQWDERGDLDIDKNAYPCLVSSFTGNFEPIPSVLVSNDIAILQIIAPMQDKAIIEAAINHFIETLNGQSFTIVTNSVKAVFKMGRANFTDMSMVNIREISDYYNKIGINITETMGVWQLTINLLTVPYDYYLGNEVSYYLSLDNTNWVEIKRVSNGSSMEHGQNNNQYFGNHQMGAVNETTGRGETFVAHYKNIAVFNALLSDIEYDSTSTSQDRVYYIRRTIGSSLITKTMRFHDGMVEYNLGDLVTITATFNTAKVV